MDFIGGESGIDARLLLFFNSLNCLVADRFMVIMTAKLTWLPFYIALVFYIVYTKGWRKGLTWIAVLCITVILADQFCSHLIRPYVESLRPTDPRNPIFPLVHLAEGYSRQGYGFPSCHAANSMVLAIIIFYIFRKRNVRIMIVCWALLHIYTRLYLGVHYPSDILAGALVGTCFAIIISTLADKFLLPHIPSFSEREKGADKKIAAPFDMSYIPISVFILTVIAGFL